MLFYLNADKVDSLPPQAQKGLALISETWASVVAEVHLANQAPPQHTPPCAADTDSAAMPPPAKFLKTKVGTPSIQVPGTEGDTLARKPACDPPDPALFDTPMNLQVPGAERGHTCADTGV